MRPRLAHTSESPAISAALPATASPDFDPDFDPDDLDRAPGVDPWDHLPSDERVAHAHDLLEQSLHAHAAGSLSSDDRDAQRLQAAIALTTLRAELGATAAGRRQVLAYAARLRAMAAR